MEITDLISTEYEECRPETPLSKVVGTFEDPTVKGVLVRTDANFDGIITRRQLAASHRNPDQTAGSVVWHVPRLDRHEDVRETARLMVEADARVLPVFEGDDLVGVVSADVLLEAVRPNLDVLTVDDVASDDLVTLAPDATFGRALNTFREHRITHLPVVAEGRATGVLGLYDVVTFAAREIRRSQGGDATAVDAHGGAMSAASGRGHGGAGAREGERDRLLDLPVRNAMSTPARTVDPDRPMDEVVAEMLDLDVSSLVVVSASDEPEAIVTKTDALEALTWGAEGHRAVQVYGADLMDDLTYDDVLSMVDGFDGRRGDMSVLDARVHFHEHDEKLRGTALVLARLRLDTDQGMYVASGTGYGSSQALNEARDIMERRIRDDKTYGQSKKHPDREYWEKRFGWWLEG